MKEIKLWKSIPKDEITTDILNKDLYTIDVTYLCKMINGTQISYRTYHRIKEPDILKSHFTISYDSMQKEFNIVSDLRIFTCNEAQEICNNLNILFYVELMSYITEYYLYRYSGDNYHMKDLYKKVKDLGYFSEQGINEILEFMVSKLYDAKIRNGKLYDGYQKTMNKTMQRWKHKIKSLEKRLIRIHEQYPDILENDIQHQQGGVDYLHIKKELERIRELLRIREITEYNYKKAILHALKIEFIQHTMEKVI